MKFNNKRVEYDGHTFDSKAERNRYMALRLLEKSGAILGLEVHPKFDIIVNAKRIAGYKADFAYWTELPQNGGVKVVEDVKPWNAKKKKFVTTAVFNLRRKLVEAMYHIKVELVK